ncbi:MAG TPA: hypothetical protein VFX58_18595 [Chitinophagaceae bacterium]|nr:hypothetical protein [Chitinophagaceae bacterium]
MNKIKLLLTLLLFLNKGMMAQVPVSQEPMHRPVFQNKYVRILDVLVPPHDTTQFHIHSIPSFFLTISGNAIASQVKGGEWVKEQMVPGNSWYRSFSPDSLVHRVANLESAPFHVFDIELLSAYDSSNLTVIQPLPFPVQYDNEKAIVCRLSNIDKPVPVKSSQPAIAIVVKGDHLRFTDTGTNQTKTLLSGQYLYIEPGTSFYIAASEKKEAMVMLFQIK